jgi:YD repeat-containing protein
MAISRRVVLAQLFAGTALGVSLAARSATAGTVTYKYDAAGRMVEATYPNGNVITYRYDWAGNRRTVYRGAAPGDFARQIRVTEACNLRTLANNAGYNGAQNATITYVVNRNVTVMGAEGAAGAPSEDGGAGGVAIETGTWPGGYTINLELIILPGGAVLGGGGGGGGGAGADYAPYWAGGHSGYGGGDEYPGSGGAGGVAINCNVPLKVTVWPGGKIIGGGSGGAGGEAYEEIYIWPDYSYFDGGGGGGGRPNGLGGAGGIGVPSPYIHMNNDPGSPGEDGTITAGGAGGAGGYAGAQGWQTGEAGDAGSSGANAYAIRKNGHTVTVINNGAISGGVV